MEADTIGTPVHVPADQAVQLLHQDAVMMLIGTVQLVHAKLTVLPPHPVAELTSTGTVTPVNVKPTHVLLPRQDVEQTTTGIRRRVCVNLPLALVLPHPPAALTIIIGTALPALVSNTKQARHVHRRLRAAEQTTTGIRRRVCVKPQPLVLHPRQDVDPTLIGTLITVNVKPIQPPLAPTPPPGVDPTSTGIHIVVPAETTLQLAHLPPMGVEQITTGIPQAALVRLTPVVPRLQRAADLTITGILVRVLASLTRAVHTLPPTVDTTIIGINTPVLANQVRFVILLRLAAGTITTGIRFPVHANQLPKPAAPRVPVVQPLTIGILILVLVNLLSRFVILLRLAAESATTGTLIRVHVNSQLLPVLPPPAVVEQTITGILIHAPADHMFSPRSTTG